MQAQKRNMERMAEAVPDSDEQVLQNFLTHSSWDHRGIMDQVASNANTCIGAEVGAGLYIDESAFEKKEWTDDPARCDEACVPRAQQVHRTKLELAEDIVRHARAIGVRFEWVGMDGGYGQSLGLLESLHAQGEVFVADIHSDRHVYLHDPAPQLPQQKPGSGRKPLGLRYHSNAQSIEVRKWLQKQPASAWCAQTLRDTTRGELRVEVMHRQVWLWDKHGPTAHRWHLIVRREVNSPATIKYSLSNADDQTSVNKLAQMQAQRFWIERAFQDAKSHVGMAQYQARKWQSWHRHMALVMMAMQFMLETRIDHAELHPLLSCYDIQILMATTMPDRRSDPDEVIRQLHERHRKRQTSIDSATQNLS